MSVLHFRWPKYLALHFTISPSNEYSGLISIRMDWFYLLAVQGTLKGLLQHHSSIAPVLWCSTFFMVQLSRPYMTSGKTITLTIWTFVGGVMALFFNTLPRFVITFLSRSNCLLISELQVTVHSDFGAQEEEICYYFHLFPFHLPCSNWPYIYDP